MSQMIFVTTAAITSSIKEIIIITHHTYLASNISTEVAR